MTYEERLEKFKNGTLTTGDGTTHDLIRFIRDKQVRTFFNTDKKIRYQVWMIPTSQFDPAARIIDFDQIIETHVNNVETFTRLQNIMTELIENSLVNVIPVIRIDNKEYKFIAEIVETEVN